jgi:hypothetical protein
MHLPLRTLWSSSIAAGVSGAKVGRGCWKIVRVHWFGSAASSVRCTATGSGSGSGISHKTTRNVSFSGSGFLLPFHLGVGQQLLDGGIAGLCRSAVT